MKKKISAALLLSAVSLTSYANIVLTEYVEGGSSNKVIEVSNLGSENVDLAVDGYKLSLYSNGKTSVQNELLLQGLLVPNSSLVVYNASAADIFKKPAPQGYLDSAGVTYFNGDDALVLSNNSGIVDSFGQVGTDPGSSWGTGDDNTKDHTLRRLASITQGDISESDEFTPSSEWAFFAKDTADGLGCTGENACTGSEPLPEDGTPIDDGSTPTDEICTNCPDITKIADRNTYDESAYYSHANAATDDSFRAALITDISANQKQLTYSEVWTALTYTDEDPNNSDNIILLYSGRSIAKKNNGSGDSSSNPDFWNREHSWPKSHGFPEREQRGYTDIHHLRPADSSMNSSRGNKDFADGGDPVAEAPANLSTDLTWEPRNEVKGDVARMMFYMDVRYDVGTDSTMPDLILVNQVGTDTSTLSDGTGKLGKLCTLLEWNTLDPVDNFELDRNNTIYEYQGNRNPFIDHPEWVERIYGNVCDNSENVAPSVEAGNEQTVTAGDSVNLSATASDSDGSINSYLWTQTSGASVTLSNADTASASFTAPNVTSKTTLVFSITVTDNNGATAQDNVTVIINPMATPVVETNKSSGGSFFYLLVLCGLGLFRKKCHNTSL